MILTLGAIPFQCSRHRQKQTRRFQPTSPDDLRQPLFRRALAQFLSYHRQHHHRSQSFLSWVVHHFLSFPYLGLAVDSNGENLADAVVAASPTKSETVRGPKAPPCSSSEATDRAIVERVAAFGANKFQIETLSLRLGSVVRPLLNGVGHETIYLDRLPLVLFCYFPKSLSRFLRVYRFRGAAGGWSKDRSKKIGRFVSFVLSRLLELAHRHRQNGTQTRVKEHDEKAKDNHVVE